MEFDLSWILLGLPVAFVLGWVASRLDVRQMRIENRQAPKAYFKGLNFLLNEQQDQAIDAFIEAVQNDPDTSELHFALGNLFRRRGEYERAVRVHEHLLSRGDLTPTDNARAQHALALDFLKAGLLDRAEDSLRKLEGTSFQNQAQLALLSIYERTRDWPAAAAVAQQLESNGQGSFIAHQAHYLCEQADGLRQDGQMDAAQALLEQAIAIAPDAARARIELATQQTQQGQHLAALKTLQGLAKAVPTAVPLFAQALVPLANSTRQMNDVLQLLKQSYSEAPSLDVLEALVALLVPPPAPGQQVRDWYALHLAHEPSLVAASKWLAQEPFADEHFHPQVQRALDHAAKPLLRYRCAACGFEARQHFWQCPGCQAWDSYPPRRVEEL